MEKRSDAAKVAESESRLGLALFTLYLAAYTGFVLLSAFAPSILEDAPLAGVNIAILYGMGLIIGAFVLALLYAWLLRRKAR